ncbi:MAG TPA: FtsX-like permease family protein, partial [Acidimicrobiales bacterium]|nr:FtsX-like permease family protein [Acidimicrobiales bacterium]
RRRLGGYLTVVVVVGLLGGIALAALAGARRTQSSYPQYLASTHPNQLTASIYTPNVGFSGSSLARQFRRIPGVRGVTTIVSPSVFALSATGVARASRTGDVLTLSSTDGEFTRIDRLSPVTGRDANPSRLDEITATPSTARLYGWRVGETVELGYFTFAQESAPGFASRPIKPSYEIRARIVGIVDASTQVIQDDVDRQYGFFFLTPALTRLIEARWPVAAYPVAYGFSLSHQTTVTQAERAIGAVVPRGFTTQFHDVGRVVTAVELAMRPVSVALGAFGVIAGLVALALAAQAIGRLVRAGDDDRSVLWALGATRRESAADTMVGAGLAGLAGVVLAMVVAVALSPLAPIGPIRPVYPTRGVSLDPMVLGVGAAILIAGLVASALVAGRRGAPGRRAPRGSVRAPSTARLLGARGVPVAASVGLTLAVGSGDRRSAGAARSVLVGTVLAVALVATTLTFASGLSTLVGRPALYGWNFSYALNPTNSVPPPALRQLQRDRDVAAWSGYVYTNIIINGDSLPVLIARAGTPVQPPVTSGHRLLRNDQIVLGAATMAALGTRVGGSVSVSYGLPRNAPLYFAPVRLRVVGTATFPAVGFSSVVADHTSMGTGALIPLGIVPAAFQGALGSTDPLLNGPELVFVRLRHGTGRGGFAGLERIAAAATSLLAHDPNPGASGNNVTVIGVQRPSQIVNYRTIGNTPLALAVGLAVGALGALAATLTASVRRRRRDLALLKTLGFTPRMVRASIAVQASVVALIGAVVGIPLGVL